MIKVAITGGIGTGKTTISSMFADKGIPVFNSDEIAKEIMNTDSLLKNEIVTAFGDKAYDKNKLNKDFKGGDIHLDSIFPPGAGNTTWTSETRGREAQIIFYINGLPYWYEKDDKSISHSVRLIRRD